MAPVAVCLVLLAGSCLQGITGFGYSLFSLPLLALLMPVTDAVPMLSVTSLFLNAQVLHHARKSTDIRRIFPLLAAGAVGLPLGVWALRSLDESMVTAVIGVLVTLSALLFLTGFRVSVRNEKLAMLPVGLASGVLNGATTLSGPPVILFLANQEVTKDTFRGSLAAYFLLLNILAIPAFIAGGLLDTGSMVRAAWHFPFVIIGAITGSLLSRKLGEGRFRKAALGFLALLGLLSLARAII